jgi:hypothetical protein
MDNLLWIDVEQQDQTIVDSLLVVDCRLFWLSFDIEQMYIIQILLEE